MKNAIWKLFTNKAAGPDKILNKTIKTTLKAIIIPLAKAVILCLNKGKLPECYKETITVVLKKPNKKDYSLLKSYQPVAFENILGKLLEKIVAERMQKAVET